MDHVFSAEQKAKLKQVVTEGMAVMQEIEDLNAGLSDTVKAVAEEIDVKPGILKKAIKTAMKSTFTDQRDDFDTLETILETVGHTL